MTTPATLAVAQRATKAQSSYRYLVTNLLTGALVADWIPLVVSSCSRQLNGIGTLTGTLTLDQANPRLNSIYIAAMEPRKSVLWVLQDNKPIWNGIIWNWSPETILNGAPLPIGASTIESLFQYRQISDDLSFTNADILDIFRGLIAYAVAKQPNGQVSGLTVQPTESGITDTIAYAGADLGKVFDAMNNLIGLAGFEYAFTPAIDVNGDLITIVQLGYPTLGLTAAQSQLAFNFPGNLMDYLKQRTGAQAANRLVATAPGTNVDANGNTIPWTSQLPNGEDLIDLGNGYPLMEDSISYQGTVAITQQSQIDAFANGVLPARTGAQETPQLILGANEFPKLHSINVGDGCTFAATSPLDPAGPNGQPGLQVTGRIVGWTLTPPAGTQIEQVALQLGAFAS